MKGVAQHLQCDSFVLDQAADLPQPKCKVKVHQNPVRVVHRLPTVEAEGVMHKRDKFGTLRTQAYDLDLDGGLALVSPRVDLVRLIAALSAKERLDALPIARLKVLRDGRGAQCPSVQAAEERQVRLADCLIRVGGGKVPPNLRSGGFVMFHRGFGLVVADKVREIGRARHMGGCKGPKRQQVEIEIQPQEGDYLRGLGLVLRGSQRRAYRQLQVDLGVPLPFGKTLEHPNEIQVVQALENSRYGVATPLVLLPVLLLAFSGAVDGILTPGTQQRVKRLQEFVAVLAVRRDCGGRRVVGIVGHGVLTMHFVLLPVFALAVLGAIMCDSALAAPEHVRAGHAALVTLFLDDVQLRSRNMP